MTYRATGSGIGAHKTGTGAGVEPSTPNFRFIYGEHDLLQSQNWFQNVSDGVRDNLQDIHQFFWGDHHRKRDPTQGGFIEANPWI